MSVLLAERPGNLNWTHNPIYFKFIYFLMPADCKLQVQILLGGQLVTEVLYPLKASTLDYCTVYVQDLVTPLTSYRRPTFLTPGSLALSIYEPVTNTANYSMQFRPVSPGTTSSFTVDQTFDIVRGGIGDMTFQGEAAINQYTTSTPPASFLPNGKGFLTWVPTNRVMRPDEWGWLLWLNHDNEAAQEVFYAVIYKDGTTAVISRPLDNNTGYMRGRTWYIPVGIEQAQLDPLNKGINFYEIVVGANYAAQFPNGNRYRIYPEYLPRYDAITLYYRNSLGGWDNISLNGEHELSADAERSEYEQSRPLASNGSNNYFASSIRPKWRAVTGYLSKKHCAALVDLLNSTECALLHNEQWLPVRVTSKSLAVVSTKNSLNSVAIEFEAAGSFTSFPKQLLNLV